MQSDIKPDDFAKLNKQHEQKGLIATCVSGYRLPSGATYVAAIWVENLARAPYVAEAALTAAQFKDARAEQQRRGFRPLWYHVYGGGHDRRYAAIWVRDPKSVAGRDWADDSELDAPTRDARFQHWAKTLRMRPLVVAAYRGDAGEQRFAAIYVRERDSSHWLWYGASVGVYEERSAEFHKDGYRPVYVAFYGDKPATDFVGIWRPAAGALWVSRVDQSHEDFSRDWIALREQGFRLEMLHLQ
jgi:hypothetical protein